MKTPTFWENSLDAINKTAVGVKRGRCSVLTKSQGGRDVYLIGRVIWQITLGCS